MSSIGAHLLGRIPSTPDDRDLKLGLFLRTDVDPLVKAMAVLQVSHAAKATKDWAAIATEKLMTLRPPAPQPAPVPLSTVWADDEPVLDQGDFGTCVGNGWAQWGNTLPVDDRFDEVVARSIYYTATVIDGTPDNPDAPGGGQQGASVRSGAKAMQQKGRLSAYAFAATVDEIRQFVQSKGPVVMGTNWTDAMFTPDPEGFVAPTGTVEGGHCYVCVGDDGDAVFLNSWGDAWGVKGRFKMRWSDVATLLAQQGEAVASVEVA